MFVLGYSQTDRGIYLPPQSLRASPAFNVFLANLPQLMDQNHLMGRIIFPTCLILLQYAPSPYYIPSAMDFQQPLYSLWALEPHARKNWLMSLVVILYKVRRATIIVNVSNILTCFSISIISNHIACN